MNTHEIEMVLEDAATTSEGWAIAYALLRCATAIQNCAFQIKYLGNGDAATPMGAVEAFGVVLKESANTVAEALHAIADKE